ncbi:MAG: rhombosortase [Woeseiaceae bacterium]|nr:rhombosortase [Woeseiaceae bacterium]
MGLDKLDRSSNVAPPPRRWLLPAIVLIAASGLLLAGETGRELLRFDRAGIGSGEIWRLVTGHFVHLGWPHFTLNAAGLLLVWYIVGNVFDTQRWLLVSCASLLSMDVGFWLLDPDLMWYVGLSGLLHGILAAGLVEKLKKPDAETIALAVLVLAKLAWEQVNGPLPGSEGTSGGAVVVDSHLFGALGGVVAAMLFRIRVRPGAPI